MAGQGKAIVFISHKLDEVMALSDEIAVLRKGEIVADMPAAEVHTKEDLARLMVGRAAHPASKAPAAGNAPEPSCASGGSTTSRSKDIRLNRSAGRNPGAGGRGRQWTETPGGNHLRLASAPNRTGSFNGEGLVALSWQPKMGWQSFLHPEKIARASPPVAICP